MSMRSRTFPRFGKAALAALVVASALALSGCGEEPRPVGSVSPSPSGTAVSQEADAPVADEPQGQVALTGAECLLGIWSLDNEEYTALLKERSRGVVDSVTGAVTLTLRTDSRTSTTYDGWTTSITTDGVNQTLVRNGADTGTYTVNGDTLKLTAANLASVIVNRVDGTETREASRDPSVFTEASFACMGDDLTVRAGEGRTFEFDRV